MFTTICRGLFDKDKLLYSFMIASQIQLHAKLVSEKEWNVFLVGKLQVLPAYLNLVMLPLFY